MRRSLESRIANDAIGSSTRRMLAQEYPGAIDSPFPLSTTPSRMLRSLSNLYSMLNQLDGCASWTAFLMLDPSWKMIDYSNAYKEFPHSQEIGKSRRTDDDGLGVCL